MNSRAKKLSLFTFAVLSLGAFTGCVDNDYDLDGVDMTIGIGNGELLLPACSTDFIRLSEILELNNSKTLIEKENGDYYYTQKGNEVNPTQSQIDRIIVEKKKEVSKDFQFSVAPYLAAPSKRTTDATSGISKDQVVYSFTYEGLIPDEVEELKSAGINGNITIKPQFSQAIKDFIPVIAELYIEFPSFIILDNVQANHPYTISGSKVIFKNVSSASDLNVKLDLTNIDFSKSGSGLGTLSTANKTLTIDADVKMGIKVTDVVANASSSANPASCKIVSSMSINHDMVITDVVGRFNPTIDLADIGSIDVEGIPDFLTNDGVVVDLDNPQISLTLASNLDVPGFVKGKLKAIKDGITTAVVDIPEANILKNATTNICICRHKDMVDATSYSDVLEVPALSTILNPIPDRIVFSCEARANKNVVCDFVLGKSYTLAPSYSFEAPLAFGENANIVYTDSFDDFNDDIKDLDVNDNTRIEFSGDIESKVPLFLNASAVAIDVDGNEMPQSEVAVTVDGEIKASADGKTPEVSTLKVSMKPSKSALKKLDGLKFTVSGSAHNEKNSASVVGQTLNAETHTLVIKNIKIKLVGQVIADLN